MMKRVFVALWVVSILLVVQAHAGVPGFMKARMGTLQGQLFIDDEQPHASGIISFFDKAGGPPPAIGSARRVPDMIYRTDASGNFSGKLLPGKYYMGALRRDPGEGPGPPRKGEEYFFATGKGGKLRVFEIKTKQVNNVGRVVGKAPGEFQEFKDFVTIKGKITDESGQPYKGIMVTIKEQLDAPRPKFVAERTAEDGSYEIKLPPGKYFVLARESLQGGRPTTGSYVGTHGKSKIDSKGQPPKTSKRVGGLAASRGNQSGMVEAVAIDAQKGGVYEGVDISLYRIPDPQETRQKFQDEAKMGAWDR